jgi:UrcA family protein
MRRFTLYIISASVLMSTTALAEEGKMHVAYGDLNLNSTAGAREMIYRIHNAAIQFCDDVDRHDPSRRTDMISGCEKTMTSLAVKQLDAPLVAALYEERQTPTEMATRPAASSGS